MMARFTSGICARSKLITAKVTRPAWVRPVPRKRLIKRQSRTRFRPTSRTTQ